MSSDSHVLSVADDSADINLFQIQIQLNLDSKQWEMKDLQNQKE